MSSCEHLMIHPGRRPLEAVQAAAVEVVLPVFRAMVEGAEGAVLDMHAQRWDGAQPPGDDGRGAVSASRYMDALVRRLTHYRCPPRRA